METEDDDILEAWQMWIAAYGELRELALQPVANGWWHDVGKRQQSGRYFFCQPDLAAFQSLAEACEEPAVHFEMPVARHDLEACIPEAWTLAPAQFLMAASQLTEAHLPIPDSCDLAVNIEGRHVRVGILDGAGMPLSRGVCLVAHATAVLDQIVTEPACRRQGMGATIVAELLHQASARGATRGLLVATAEGRPFYEALGWTCLSEVSTAVSPVSTRAVTHLRVIARQ